MVALEKACAQNGNVRLVREEEVAARVKQLDPFHWMVNVRSHRLGLRPDKVFGLENTQTGERSHYFLEADRGTMPIVRRNLTQSSFHRKLLAYEATWKQNIHRSRFGFHRFRVLTVTTSAERTRSMLETCGELDGGHGLFLFAEAKPLLETDPLVYWWVSGHSVTVTLIER